jgi:8-oxo-dGTP diphosphatase
MIDVSCAIIKNEFGDVLVTQRSITMSLPLKWEFPGGKIEANETAEDCLIREIKEELNLNISIITSIEPSEYHYSTFSIRLIPFICLITSGEIKLTEHAVYCWLPTKELLNLDWAEADLPVLKRFLNQIND